MASKRFRNAVGIDPDRVISAAVEAALGESQPRSSKKHHPGRVLAAGAALAAAAAVGQRRMPRLAKVPLRMGLHKLGDMTHVDDLADALRDRLAGHDEPDDEYDDEEYDDEEEFDDDEPEDDAEFDGDPRDEAVDEPEDDEDFDDEDDEGFDDEPEDDGGPRGEGDDAEPEPEDDEPEGDADLEDEELEDAEPEDDIEGEADDEEPEAVEDDEDLEDEDEQIAARSVDLGISRDAGRQRPRDHVPDLFEALRKPHRRAPVMRRGSPRVDPATRPPKPDESRSSGERKGRPKKPKSKAARA